MLGVVPAKWNAELDRLPCEPAPYLGEGQRAGYRLVDVAQCSATRDLLGHTHVYSILIEEGFLWNGASIPRPLWSIVGSPFDPRFMRASAVHDALYQYGSQIGVTRLEADEVFFALLLEDGVSKKRAMAMYQAVRWFGRGYYNRAAMVEEVKVSIELQSIDEDWMVLPSNDVCGEVA